MALQNSFSIRPLEASDARSAAAFLEAQPGEYARFFYAFAADEMQLAAIFDRAERDVYAGVFWRGGLLGIFMLRGWDAGYEIPSFGVFIDEKHKGGALMRLTLDAAKNICRLAGAKKLMAKIHPDNVSPRGARRLGFYEIGREETSGNVIYHMDL